MKGTVELDNVEKEFKYTKEYMGHIKDKATVITEEFQNTKSKQEENVREITQMIEMSWYSQMDQLWETQGQQEQGWWSTWMDTSQCRFFSKRV